MAMTSRENVWATLRFEGPEWIPRETWMLPWANLHLPEAVAAIRERYPDDLGWAPSVYKPSPRLKGTRFTVGTYVDEWGCIFENAHEGIHGQVKNPILVDLNDWKAVVQPPVETLPDDRQEARDIVNRGCAESHLFIRGGGCPRPWERYQFLRGTEEAMVDIMFPEDGFHDVIKRIHDFYLREIEFWVSTDIDGIFFMDDWGSQSALLIPPPIWRTLFKPLYKDYCDLAHANGKAVFMHSDGYIQEIYPDLVEIGIDALNSQLFVMDMEVLASVAKGKMTFWGEMDRQHVLPAKDPQVGRQAVRKAAKHLYDPSGGIMAQFELTPGSNAATALAVHDEWEKVHAEARSSEISSDPKKSEE